MKFKIDGLVCAGILLLALFLFHSFGGKKASSKKPKLASAGSSAGMSEGATAGERGFTAAGLPGVNPLDGDGNPTQSLTGLTPDPNAAPEAAVEEENHSAPYGTADLAEDLAEIAAAQKAREIRNVVLPTDNRQIFGKQADSQPNFYMYVDRYIDGVNTRPWTGGKYGYVRTPRKTAIGKVYTRLHEGIDIKPVKRDKSNNPLDDIYALSDGKVVYVNSSSGASNYGKYLVIRHDWPEGPFYTLYAHLASAYVSTGKTVKAGDKVARMGYTGKGLNRERSHLHLELAFMTTDRYNYSYNKNIHRNYSGLNLIGMDVARFLEEYQDNPSLTLREFLDGEEPYFKVHTSSAKKPGILKRHPFLGKNMQNESKVQSWEITFNRAGVPLSFEPIEEDSMSTKVVWVKTVNTNHSYLTSGRLSGSGSKASLTSSGTRFVDLLTEKF